MAGGTGLLCLGQGGDKEISGSGSLWPCPSTGKEGGSGSLGVHPVLMEEVPSPGVHHIVVGPILVPSLVLGIAERRNCQMQLGSQGKVYY